MPAKLTKRQSRGKRARQTPEATLRETLASLRALLTVADAPGTALPQSARNELGRLVGKLIQLRYQALVETLVFAEVERWSWDVMARSTVEKQAAITRLIAPVTALPHLDQLHQRLCELLDAEQLATAELLGLIEQTAADTARRLQAAGSLRYRLQLQRVDLAPFHELIALNLGHDLNF